MGLNLWDKEDIENILLSLHQATLQSGADGEYGRGYEAALVSVALAFGVELKTVPEMQATQLAIPKRLMAQVISSGPEAELHQRGTGRADGGLA